MRIAACFLMFIMFCLSFSWDLSAQSLWNGVGHIPSSEQVNWTNAGLLPSTPKVANVVYDVTRESGANWDQKVEAAIQEAMNDTVISVIYFPAGVYQLNSPIILNQENGNNIIFQGDGSNNTCLEFLVGSTNQCFYFYGLPTGNPLSMNCSIDKGSNTLAPTNFNFSTNFNAGDWVHFYEATFPGINNSDFPICVGQITQLEDVSDYTAIIKDEASKAYSPDYSLSIQKILPITNVGIENLKIKRLDTGHSNFGYNIQFRYAVNCWVKGVESEFTSRYHVDINYSSHIEVSGCYFHESRDYGPDGRGYGVTINNSSTNCLVQNNVFKKLRHAMVLQGGANCNVVIYNYSREQYWTWKNVSIPWIGGDLLLHGNYPYSNLLEHNWIEKIWADNACFPEWVPNCTERQNGPYNAFVRNVAYDHDGYLHTLDLESAPNTSVLGCELAYENFYSIGLNNSSLSVDLYGIYVAPDWGNPPYTYETGTIFTHDRYGQSYWAVDWYLMWLADVSYYYSERPSFLGSGFSFPSLGPTPDPNTFISMNIPAKSRWSSSIRTYLADATIWPLSCSITGPGSLNPNQSGTFTANVSGGQAPYTYKWYLQYECDGRISGAVDDSTHGTEQNDGNIDPTVAPCGNWGELWATFGTIIASSNTYSFRLKVVVTDAAGRQATAFKGVDINGASVASFDDEVAFWHELKLEQNNPNPFNSFTTIRYSLPQAGPVTIEVYDISGRLVRTLVNTVETAGEKTVFWNG